MNTLNTLNQSSVATVSGRQNLLNQHAITLWLTGLSGAGKSSLALALESALHKLGRVSFVLDGDHVRHGLNRDLGFSIKDRSENIRRSAEVAKLMNEAGLIVICSLISPARHDREIAKTIIGADNYFEVYLSTPLNICEERDPKGLYRRARAGEIKEFTGISASYEMPVEPALTIDTSQFDMNTSVAILLNMLTDVLSIKKVT